MCYSKTYCTMFENIKKTDQEWKVFRFLIIIIGKKKRQNHHRPTMKIYYSLGRQLQVNFCHNVCFLNLQYSKTAIDQNRTNQIHFEGVLWEHRLEYHLLTIKIHQHLNLPLRDYVFICFVLFLRKQWQHKVQLQWNNVLSGMKNKIATLKEEIDSKGSRDKINE